MRLLYCYPSYFTEELIDEIATNPKVRTARVISALGASRARFLQSLRATYSEAVRKQEKVLQMCKHADVLLPVAKCSINARK